MQLSSLPFQRLDQHLASIPAHSLASQLQWRRRAPRKISPAHWIRSLCLLALCPAPSLAQLAWLLSLVCGSVVSKQAARQRLLRQGSALIQQALLHLLPRQILRSGSPPPALGAFGRLLLQDSTLIPLGSHLAHAFPGPRNQHSGPTAQLRIQALWDLFSGRYLHFHCSGFTRNDQRASIDVLAHLRQGDLVLRDLGYFVLQSFREIAAKGACFLSRLRLDTSLLDPQTLEPIDLLKTLRRCGRLDCPLLMGSQARIPCRLVAIPVPPALAAQRRRRARANRDQRLNPSKKRLALLDWQLFVTNASTQDLSAQQIAEVYQLRWNIEIIFKAWKSHFHLENVPLNASADQVQALVYARLICILLFQTLFFPALAIHAWNTCHRHLSFLKTAGLFAQIQAALFTRLIANAHDQLLFDAFCKHGTYDRRKRVHLQAKLHSLS